MTATHPSADAEFDGYAEDYDAALQQGLQASGESKEYFAEHRMRWLAGRLARHDHPAGRVLDFGCGTGSSTPYFLAHLGADDVLGVDVSAASLRVAARTHGSARARFGLIAETPLAGAIDTAFTNGTFHHIPPAERADAVRYVWKALRPGGLFAFWENNPWNPGTRYIMSRVPFDRDAITLAPPEARALLRAAGFTVLHTDFRFWFPRALAALRPLERLLTGVPLGGQYLVLARKG